jgi:hypothetical protein
MRSLKWKGQNSSQVPVSSFFLKYSLNQISSIFLLQKAYLIDSNDRQYCVNVEERVDVSPCPTQGRKRICGIDQGVKTCRALRMRVH